MPSHPLVVVDVNFVLVVTVLCVCEVDALSIPVPATRLVRSSPPASHAPPNSLTLSQGDTTRQSHCATTPTEARAYDADILESVTRPSMLW